MKRKWLVLICIAVLLFSGWKLMSYFFTYQTVEKQSEVIQAEREQYTYEQLQTKYKDIVG